MSCKPVLRVCDIKQTGVEEMVKQTSVEVVEGVLSRKPVLRGCVIEQTNLKEMRYHANRC